MNAGSKPQIRADKYKLRQDNTLFVFFVAVIFSAVSAAAQVSQNYQRVPGIIHVHTKASDGIFSVEEIAKRAKSKGIKIVILTDSAMRKAQYSPLPFLRSIINKTVELNSVLKYGPGKYLKEIETANKSNPDMVIIPGVEVSPFYYWEGNYFRKNLVMHNWHKNILVIGLDKSSDYKYLPMVSNGKSRFNQYQGDKGSAPYQDLIDYVNEKGGLCFWSAPEVKTETTYAGIKLLTLSYYEELLHTSGYTGFAAFFEGYRKIGEPAGVWDEVLMEYCKGKRGKPVWTIGEIDYHYEGEAGGKTIDEVQTVFYLPNVAQDFSPAKISRQSILNALRSGKMYALWKTKEYGLILDKFFIDVDGKPLIMGDEITSSGRVKIYCNIISSDGKAKPVKVKVIKSGSILKIFEGFTPMNVRFQDSNLEKGRKIYYRLDIEGKYPHRIFTNPVFVNIK